jgi:hypothetical protein
MSFDDLRDEASSKPFIDEGEAEYYAAAGTGGSRRRSSRFLGMTSFQRFVLVFLLMIATCVIGTLCLFATGRIAF